MAIAAAAGFAMSGCSPGADYPSIFPAVHDMPPPRADKPMDADQVQQATETLITERNQLSGEAQVSTVPASIPAKKPAQAQVQTSASAKKPPAAAAQNAGTSPPATAASTQTAGADTKP